MTHGDSSVTESPEAGDDLTAHREREIWKLFQKEVRDPPSSLFPPNGAMTYCGFIYVGAPKPKSNGCVKLCLEMAIEGPLDF